MTILSRLRRIVTSTSARQALYHWLTSSLAAVTLATSLAFTILLWPIPTLGFAVADPHTATIASIAPDSAAASAGLHIGDRVLQMYGRSWEEVITHPNILTLIGAPEQPIPISIERIGVVHTLALVPGAPDIAFQTTKVTNFLLVLLCWLTGYILGVVRRHESSGSPLVACFWLGMSGVLGSYFFASYASYPLSLALRWLMLTVLIPLAISIHLWFPMRRLAPRQAHIAYCVLAVSVLLLNGGGAAALALWRPSFSQLLVSSSDLVLIGWVVAFMSSGAILYDSYRRTRIAHLRRQVRLIAMACLFVAVAWLLLLVLPKFADAEPLIADHWLDLLTGMVPLAYLVGGVAPDLYRIDRIALRLGLHAATIAVLAGMLAAAGAAFSLHGTTSVLWAAVTFVALYRPVQQLGRRLLPATADPTHAYRALDAATSQLVSTLDARVLVDVLCGGVRATFGAPALACYLGDITGSNHLTCLVRERLPQLPKTIAAGTLTDQLCRLPPIAESRAIHAALGQQPLSDDEEHLLHHPGLVLWCPIRHTEGHLLGVLLMGMRGDLDPYRSEDLRALQRLLEATALALANSAAYAQQHEAEATIRQLYQHLDAAQAQTAAAIARELHDELINVNVRLNIVSLQKVIDQVQDPDLRAELDLVLESERAEAEVLRMICEQLYPTGLDDPLGLAALLRMQVTKTQALWPGICRLIVEQTPCPMPAQTQREAVRIAQEALTNAVKHAGATEIVVHLRYSDTPDGTICLAVRDNGRADQAVIARPGHWGVRNMYERARAVGGTLQFRRNPDGGTTVVFMFSAEPVAPPMAYASSDASALA